MNQTTKRHVKLLAERFEHEIHYDRNAIQLSNFKNSIQIKENHQHDIEVTYNFEDSNRITEVVPLTEIYDLLIKIFTRYELEKVKYKKGEPIQLKEWLETEFGRNSREIDLKRKIQRENSDHVIMGGNRLEAEYFKGVLILMDDILVSPCNVIDFPLDE